MTTRSNTLMLSVIHSLIPSMSPFFTTNVDKNSLKEHVFIPKDLAKLEYELRFLIYSTQSSSLEWIADYSESFRLKQSGWNTLKYKWRGNARLGNENCIRGFGVLIIRPETAPVWKGEIYFDEIKW